MNHARAAYRIRPVQFWRQHEKQEACDMRMRCGIRSRNCCIKHYDKNLIFRVYYYFNSSVGYILCDKINCNHLCLLRLLPVLVAEEGGEAAILRKEGLSSAPFSSLTSDIEASCWPGITPFISAVLIRLL